MHCAYCRHENPRSSRFCVNCSAVLVESGKDGRPRRVLRPWGLLRQAPLTVTPSMPDMAEARAAHLGSRSHRPLAVALTAVAVVAAAVFAYSRPRLVEAEAGVSAAVMHSAPLQASEPVRALTPTRHAVEVAVAAPPLTEPVRTSATSRKPPSRADAARTQDPKDDARRVAQRAALTQPATYVVASSVPRDPVIADGQSVVAAAPEPAPVALPASVPFDRWEPLRTALAGCEAVDGIFAKATCAERARIDNCVNFWGHHPLCPVRVTSGQWPPFAE